MSNIDFTKEDLEKVATLSRLTIPENEKEEFVNKMKKVLEYIEEVNSINSEGINNSGEENYSKQFENTFNKDMMRDENLSNQGGEYTKDILENAPAMENNFIKVSKVIKK